MSSGNKWTLRLPVLLDLFAGGRVNLTASANVTQFGIMGGLVLQEVLFASEYVIAVLALENKFQHYCVHGQGFGFRHEFSGQGRGFKDDIGF